MVSANKILTVSYGTFSCTLEGFDDPFSTMRSIAEYFRDLAAEDRYFGAEPPQPDAEMLHRIAEREVKRRVEARVEENGVVLRQAEGAPAEARPPEAETPLIPGHEPAPNPLGTLSEAAPVPAAQAPAPAPGAPAPASTLKADRPAESGADDADSIAARLKRIRAAVGQSVREELAERTAETFETEPAEQDFFTGQSIGAAFAAPLPTEEEAAETSVRMTEEQASEAEAEAAIPDSPPTPENKATETEPVETEAHAAAEGETPAEAAEDARPEVRAAAGEEPGEAAAPAEEEDSILARIAAAEPAEAAPAPSEVPAADATEHTEALETADAAEEQELAEPANDFADEDDFADEEALMRAILGDGEAEATPERPPEPLAPTEAAGDRVEETNIFAEEADQAEAHPGLPARPEAPVARVVRVRRSQTPRPPAVPEGQSSLSPEDEADLAAALAAAEAEDGSEPEARGEAPAVEQPGPFIAPEATDLPRIIAETEVKFAEEEASGRRDLISRLRAAVQIKRADTIEGPQRDHNGAFRDDLAKAVRPRRPVAAGQNRHRLAPLMLVSEQRIDAQPASATERAEPVRPRRVEKPAGEADEAQSLAAGFAEFVEGQTIADIEEATEAAAAYLTHVVGMAIFTRPKIMLLVQHHSPLAPVSREEALRAFGKLIREGVIVKHGRGQYELARETRFNGGGHRVSA